MLAMLSGVPNRRPTALKKDLREKHEEEDCLVPGEQRLHELEADVLIANQLRRRLRSRRP